MEFYAVFRAGIPSLRVVCLNSEYRGVDLLLRALTEGVRELDKVSEFVEPFCQQEVTVKLPLENAIESNLGVNKVCVYVPEGGLNSYVIENVRFQNGMWRIVRGLDEQRLIEDWRSAGYPLVWNL